MKVFRMIEADEADEAVYAEVVSLFERISRGEDAEGLSGVSWPCRIKNYQLRSV